MHARALRFLMVAVGVGFAGVVPASAQPSRSRADSAHIVGVLAGLDSAWHAGDADRWVAAYAPAPDFLGFINISGTRMADRDLLRSRLAQIFTGIFRGSRHVGTLHQLRFLGDDVAVADEDIEITQFTGLPAGIAPTAPGVLRTRMRHVLQRRTGRWLIVASQNTAVAP